jgi:hypothetical protein
VNKADSQLVGFFDGHFFDAIAIDEKLALVG